MTASPGGAGEGGISGDGGASSDDAAFTGGIELADPVKASEADTTLPGSDNDKNGVRDDLDTYLSTLEADSRKLTVLVSFARESTAMMLLGGKEGTTRAEGFAQAKRVGRTIDCLHDLYAEQLPAKQIILANVRNALYNNAQRLRAYNHASTLVSGSIFHGGHGCDSTITGVSQ